MTTTRRLILLRHAKAESFATTDHERALTDRGRDDAAALGRRLEAEALVPTDVLVSSARRARETWESVAQQCGADSRTTVDRALYDGGLDAVHDAVRALPDDAATVLVVGHNPTVASLAHLLADGRGDPEALAKMDGGYPTCAAAVLELVVPWSQLDVGSGRLVAFLHGAA